MKLDGWRWPVLTVATALALTACAQGTATPQGSDKTKYDSSAKLSGSASIMGFGAGDEIATVRYEKATAAMPDVNFSLIEGDLDIQQFLSAVAAGDPPDIVYANRDQIGTFASRGAIISLDSCIEGEGIDTSQYASPALDQVTFSDSIYAIPEFNTVQITMANSSVLSAAGLSLEDVNGSKYDDVVAKFGAGTGAFLLAGSWNTAALDPVMGDNLGFFAPPPAVAGDAPSTTGGTSLPFTVTSASKNPDAGAAYINFLTSDEAMKVIAETGNLPVLGSAALAPAAGGGKDVYAAYEQVTTSGNLLPYLDYATPTFSDTLGAALQDLLAGKQTPAEFTETLQADYGAFIGE